MSAEAVEQGQTWYIWGKHYLVQKVQNGRALIVPPERKKPVPADWVETWRILKFGTPSGA